MLEPRPTHQALPGNSGRLILAFIHDDVKSAHFAIGDLAEICRLRLIMKPSGPAVIFRQRCYCEGYQDAPCVDPFAGVNGSESEMLFRPGRRKIMFVNTMSTRDNLLWRLSAIDPSAVKEFGNIPLDALERIVQSVEEAKADARRRGSRLASDWANTRIEIER